MATAHRQTDRNEEQYSEQAAADQLPAGGEQDHLAGAYDLLQVDFQPDHEQHEDQAEFRDDGDRILGLDPAHAEWTNEEPGDKVGEDQGLPGENLAVSGAFYVPVYSSVSMSQGKLRADFSVTLTVHNASEIRPLVLKRIAYFDTSGKMVESSLKA